MATWVKACALTIALAVISLPGCKKKSEVTPAVEPPHGTPPAEHIHNAKPAVDPPVEQPQPSTSVTTDAPSMSSIIRQARSWGPAFSAWYGKQAPDFVLADVNDKTHRLSDYRGKQVLLIFWATWCGPCLIEIPHLITLRKSTSENELAMLAISREPPALVKGFAAANKLNYTVLVDQGKMPMPYAQVNSIPSSFFIGPDGKIKLATVGLIPLDDIKAILKAKWP